MITQFSSNIIIIVLYFVIYDIVPVCVCYCLLTYVPVSLKKQRKGRRRRKKPTMIAAIFVIGYILNWKNSNLWKRTKRETERGGGEGKGRGIFYSRTFGVSPVSIYKTQKKGGGGRGGRGCMSELRLLNWFCFSQNVTSFCNCDDDSNASINHYYAILSNTHLVQE